MGEIEKAVVCRVCGEAAVEYELEDEYICEKCLEAERGLGSITPTRIFRILKPKKIR